MCAAVHTWNRGRDTKNALWNFFELYTLISFLDCEFALSKGK